MNFSEIELQTIYDALVIFSITDDSDIDEFKKKHNLSDDEFDDLTISLRKRISSQLERVNFEKLSR